MKNIMNEKFSKRFGYSIQEKQITVREEAPLGLREFLIQSLYAYEYFPSFLREVICLYLRKSPDKNNWSERPNIADEVNDLIEQCEWFQVYDLIEIFSKRIQIEDNHTFEEDINDYFKMNGIGWKLENGKIVFRGDEFFETNLKTVEIALEKIRANTTKQEIREAIRDLSRKPHPDVTGAIQHARASLECLCRDFVNSSETLGSIINNNPRLFPHEDIKHIAKKFWTYSSNFGSHLQEGQEPSFEEAELLVGLSASLTTYLARKISISSSSNSIQDLGNPFDSF